MKKLLLLSIAMLMTLLILCGCSTSNGKVDQNQVRKELDTFIEEKMADGTIEAMNQFWYDQADTPKELDYSKLDAKNGTIRLGTKSCKPFAFLKNKQWTGMTIEIIYTFCLEKGYGLQIESYSDTNAVVLATSTGKCDVGGANISVTEERKKSVDYSPVYYYNHIGIAINKAHHDQYQKLEDFENTTLGCLSGSAIPSFASDIISPINIQEYNNLSDACLALSQDKIESVSSDEIILNYAIREYPNLELTCPLSEDDAFGFVYAKDNNGNGFFNSLTTSFNRTFIEDNRWQLILKGVANTLLITLSSILFGSALGFVVYLWCRKNGKISNTITSFCQWIIEGLPAVVFLMIVYYLILGNVNINNILVSIITFSLIFASSMFSMVKNAVLAIDDAQYEVSYALGYSEKETFYKMILPQAAKLFWSPYRGAVKTQIKATAIVGYIAAMDLTKVGDMIRSTTYEAFFPLITIAILYFILGWLLVKLVDCIRIQTEPSARKSARYLKGVQTHD